MSVMNRGPRSWYELSNESRRIIPMEGMRGLAVTLVFFVHFNALAGRWFVGSSVASGLGFAWSVGQSGVDLFFVLSGFLIYGAVIKDHFRYPVFLRRRVQRIYPVFVVILVIYLVLSVALPAQSKLAHGMAAVAGALVVNLLLLPGLLPLEPIITVAWSLSYEFFYYLTLPLICAAAGLRNRSARSRVVFFAAAALCAFTLGVALPSAGTAWSIRLFRMLMFVSGILVFEAIRHFRDRIPTGAGANALAAVGIVASLGVAGLLQGSPATTEHLTFLTGTIRVLALFLGLGFAVAVAFAGDGMLARAFSWTPLRWLGNMSYSYYLVHGLALQALALVLVRVLPSTLPSWAALPLLVLAFAVTWVAATVIFLLVERPLSLNVVPGRVRVAA